MYGSLAPRTYENYELNVRRLEPYIGSLRLNALKPDHIKAAYRKLLDNGLSARTVQQAHRTLRAALRQAVKSEHLFRDPTFGVKLPRAEDREDVVMTPDHIRALFAATSGHYLFPVWVVLATTGMRLGEALGLQWRDIDFDQGSMTIKRQAQRQQGLGMVLSGLKTPASRRTVPLALGTIEVLLAQRLRCQEQCTLMGLEWNDSRQVFSRADSALLDPSSVNKSFHRALERAGLPDCHPHDLRHTLSSFIQSRGRTEREAQEVLGHASASTTRDVYTHVMPDRRRDIMLPVEEFFAHVDSDAPKP